MKRIATALIITMLTIGLASLVQSATLIAYYPLSSDANDATGNNPPMTLVNTPFQDNGIYCNGNYSGPDSCRAITPSLGNLDFESFIIKVDFKVSEWPSGSKPVFVGGSSYRWIAFYLRSDGTVMMKYNNSNYEYSSIQYQLNTWHEAKITYSRGIGRLYLDGVIAASVPFEINHGNDSDVGIRDGSNATIFKGHFAKLRIYNNPSCGPSGAGGVYLSSVDGLVDSKIPAGGEVAFHYWYQNCDAVNNVVTMTNGYVLGATGGVTWDASYYDEFDFDPSENFDLGWFHQAYGWNGQWADTVGIAGMIEFGAGLPPGYHGPGVRFEVTIDPNPAFNGQTFCIDSSFFPSSGVWMWIYGSAGVHQPGWDGPHCYEIVAGPACCREVTAPLGRGNVDYDPGDILDISDLVYLVDYMFTGGPPPTCWAEANVDAVGPDLASGIDISDLVYLVDFMFSGGPPPVACP